MIKTSYTAGAQGWDYVEDVGGGAFYGPKIDIKVTTLKPSCALKVYGIDSRP